MPQFNPSNIAEEQENLANEIQTESDVDSEEETVVIPANGKQSRKIVTKEVDREVDFFHRAQQRGKLILQPDFQRYYIWPKAKASKLIESALLDVPLPAVYLFEEEDGNLSVIDGQQRLTAFVSFVRGNFLDNGEPFALSGLKVLKDLNKRQFSDDEFGEERRDKILATTIRAITFKKESDRDLKFEVFERLNAESTSLNSQELRNCVYRGSYNDLLKRLSENSTFRFLMGIEKPEKRMQDVEYVLRFAAFYNQTYLKYSSPVKRFLNHDMEKNKEISNKDAKKLENAFKQAVGIIRSLLGDKAFKRFIPGVGDNNRDGRWETQQFNASLYDVLMWQFAQPDLDSNLVYQHSESIYEGLIDLMAGDAEFREAITLSTSSVKNVQTRFSKFNAMVKAVIGNDQKQPRCFTRKLKEELYNKNPVCNICETRIVDVDDAAVDHIEQYWAGGKTIEENARLTHRYCNSTRPRKG